MAQYTVWVAAGPDAPHLNLTQTNDQGAATQLVATLVSATAGVTLEVGIDIVPDAPPPPPAPSAGSGTMTPAPEAPQPPAYGATVATGRTHPPARR